MTAQAENTKALMQRYFSREPALAARAPGRVNLIGEHTDYNGGYVLPCAIDFYAEAAIAPRKDKRVRLLAADYGHVIDEFSLTLPIAPHPEYAWSNYARGVIQILQQHAGALPHGFDLAVSGCVPQGAGLSSSAAYETVLLTAISALFNLQLDAVTIAKLGQKAENNYVGCQCGIMDQLISAAGKKDHALLIDCQHLTFKPAPMNPAWTVLIINSNVKRGLVDSKYNERRQQCEQAAAILGVDLLQNASLEQLKAAKTAMPDTVYRRAKHIITDSRRAVELAAALAADDMPAVSRLMADSHASMQYDFENTHPHVDTLVEIISTAIGTDGGARMTGGGFGGCVVSLVKNGMENRVIDAVNAHYTAKTGLTADIYQCSACDGAHVLPA